jgi:hypothetical protein
MNKSKRVFTSIGILLFALIALFALAPAQAETLELIQPVDTDLIQIQPTRVLVVEPDTATIYLGGSQQYRAFVSIDGGATLGEEVTEQCVWSIDNPAIAALGAAGYFTGSAVGGTTVRATFINKIVVAAFPTLYGSAQLIVREPVSRVKYWLEVEPKTATIYIGESQQYRAYLYRSDSDDPTEVTNTADWNIVEDIADMTSEGKYKGTVEGSSSLSATYKDMSDDARLIVEKRRIIERVPPTEDLPEGKILDRQPGYITLTEPQDLGNPGAEFTMTYNNSLMDGNPDRYPKVFYWNKSYEKWVALASYPQTPGVIKAKNDGNYSGWFVVFGCIQPKWNDITAEWNWAEQIANRMNGLGLLEGYPDPANPSALVRPAGLGRTITRAELTAFTARILGLAPGDTHLYPTITYLSDMENNAILGAKYSDASEIAAWARPYVAAMTNANLVKGKGERFAPNDKTTRIEAAVLISNALKDVPGFGHPADLSVYTDADLIPAWAIGQVAEGTIGGYPDGSLRPNQPINRAESMVLLLKLLRGLGW